MPLIFNTPHGLCDLILNFCFILDDGTGEHGDPDGANTELVATHLLPAPGGTRNGYHFTDDMPFRTGGRS